MSLSQDQPNILLLFTDQFRFDYMGCAGADFVRTPNLDRLAARGVRFSNCYTNSPICVPARIGLATGMIPAAIGSVDNASFLLPQFTTYYQRLRDAGYRVACSGKLDLAKPDNYNGREGCRPRTYQWGFTDPIEIEGKGHSLGRPDPQGPYGAWLEERGLYEEYYEERHNKSRPEQWFTPSELPAETFLDVYQGQRAVEWLEELPPDSPWHMFVSFSGPHVSEDPPREYFDRYADVEMPDPVPPAEDVRSRHYSDRCEPGNAPTDPEKIQDSRRAYCAYIELIDEQIGHIMEMVEDRGELNNTYILFSSDHGEMLGDLGLWTKSLPHEPSTGVPLIVAGPGIPEGHTTETLVEVIDINPTLCELAGLPQQKGIHAESFVPTLRNPDTPHRPDAISAMRRWWMIRDERYKLVQYWNDEDEMYDLREDPHETVNCIERMRREEPQVVEKLIRRVNDRFCPNPYSHHKT